MRHRAGSAANIVPIERRPLHDELADQLRRAIIHGELRPGAKISEKDLCEQFGVSRTPIRETLKILSTEGLVSFAQNRGASVTEVTAQDIMDAFPVMGALEALAGELACANATQAQIDRLGVLQSKMVAMFKRGDRRGYFRINEQIHQLILEASCNSTLPRLIRAASAQVRRARYMANLSNERWAEAIEEHEQILKAIEARDGKLTSRLLRNHLTNKLEALKKAFLEQVD
ncbi:MAG: GntR family transcriptional regulator [Alphaproteobacteria bacterium]|nr:GntR family transcriptional regulator [Alphaproteobacteria bacterium]